ncbi:hypothetical protein A3H75_02495 [Candidatus Uhrbacteria bacterium RIFCSPLOWO2_02_FULL_51_9]|uniref:SHS2 domain-containing protein n=1 Tax=Candidatus Uhrbacteria bacterium RIFCSPLOWO2_02_FULL_51_9 TaxID=1802410 RepID=A0A1F7VFP0_9BACT|nr:MAG: hypothetical protein A3H75_02495 [Candidatus Uhrbacteria bacterium RIFCSPLOWO2_02_FULL_51_9]
MWFSRKKEDGRYVMGVDLGVGGIKLVELESKNGRAYLSTYGFTEGFLGIEKKAMSEEAGGAEKPGQPAAAAEVLSKEDQAREAQEIKRLGAALKMLVEKSGAKGKEAVASIPISSVFSAVITVTKTDDKAQIAGMVQQEAKKLLPVAIEDVVLDYSPLPEIFTDVETVKKTRMKLMMTAAPRKVIERYTTIFKQAGLNLKSLETESFALVRALIGNDPSAVMLLDMGMARTNVYLIRGAVPLMHRSINIGGRDFSKALVEKLHVTPEEAEQMKIDLAMRKDKGAQLLDAFKPAADPIVQEIKYHMQLFEKQLGGSTARPEKIILTGGSSLLPNLDAYLEDYFQMRVYVGDPWARIVYPDVLKMALDQIGPRFGISIGLALMEALPQKEEKQEKAAAK